MRNGKQMNMQVLIVGISVLLICVGLRGCVDDNDVQDNRNDGFDIKKYIFLENLK